jgi:hypothetical protein
MVVGCPGLVRVTVQVPPLPGTTSVGLQTSDERVGVAIRDNVVVRDAEPRVAVMLADPAELTVPAVAVKVAEV